MLYYDVVELPDSPVTWYEKIGSMEMRGWVALGDFLSKPNETGYGFDLIVLDSICDRINLQRTTVHDLLIQFTDPKKMALTQIATTINTATAEGKSELEIFEAVQAKLHQLCRLAANLKPTEGSTYDVWHAVVQKRLRGLLHLVVGPRIRHLHSGAPLITAATSENLPKNIKDGIKLNYMYEALQQERQVPLVRYGIHSDMPPHVYLTPPSSSPPSAVSDLGDAELARSHAVGLMKENQDLYAQIAKLTRENEKLVESNENLARKVATLGQNQPVSYLEAAPEGSESVTAPLRSSTPESEQDLSQPSSFFLQVPQPRARPRSLSHDTGEKLAASLEAKLNFSQRTHKRQHSELLSWKYEDVFSGLDEKPAPALRLSDPVTGELVAPITPPVSIPPRHPDRAVSYAPDRSRRSGMIFDKGSLAYLAHLGDSTPNVDESQDKEDEVDVSTPTPLPRARLE